MDPLTIGLALASQFAPQLLKYFTNSDTAAAVAGQVIDIAKKVTGKDQPAELEAALKADPKAVLDFQLALAANEADLEKAYLADRADARKRDTAFITAGRENWRADIMVLIDAIGLIACLAVLALYRKELPAEAATLISTVASIFGLCLRDAHQFEFGSSRGSQQKDNYLRSLTK